MLMQLRIMPVDEEIVNYVNNLLGDQVTYSYSEGILTITSKNK